MLAFTILKLQKVKDEGFSYTAKLEIQ